jgi:NADPH:quinone reductase-like Zn-dependent oxidoreductase
MPRELKSLAVSSFSSTYSFSTPGKITILNVENKVVIIAGASSGIGEATAKFLSRNGAKVILGARRTDRLEAILKKFTQRVESLNIRPSM